MMTKRKLRSVSLLATICTVAALAGGCSHSITVIPDSANLATGASTQKIDARVGYFIPVSSTNLEVTTPGGGGDSVRYYPYKDIESGYKLILNSIFRSVTKLSESTAKTASSEKVDYVMEPTIITNSGGSGFVTYPPTNFSVDLTNEIRDPSGRLVGSRRVVGLGVADTGERMGDHGIAGRRAMADALIKMRAALLESDLGKRGVNATAASGNDTSSVENRLAQLLDLKNKGLISTEEYEVKRKNILDSL